VSEQTEGKQIIMDAFYTLVTPCDCEHEGCLTNYGKCRDVAAVRANMLKIFRKISNSRNVMLSDVVAALYDAEMNLEVRRHLAKVGEDVTSQHAAMDILVQALITVPGNIDDNPLEYVRGLRREGEKIMENNFRIEVQSVPSPTLN
jgi:hypothetical protein